ncbi:MAG: hypothetical protein ACRDZX_14260 [Acidimicrobiales bacterium]
MTGRSRPPPGYSWVEVRLSELARPPSPGELEAISVALGAILGAPLPALPVEPGPWRFSGRWWRRSPGGPALR